MAIKSKPGADPAGGSGWHALVFQRAPCPVFVVDSDGAILIANAEAARLSGYGESDLIGADFVDRILGSNTVAADRDRLRATVRACPAEPFEQSLRTRDGRSILARFVFVRVPSPSGEGDATLCVGEDITRHRREEETLRASERHAKEAFLLLAAFSRISGRILHESSLDEVCMLCIEAIREHSIFSRAILTLIDERGNGYLWYFTGLSDEEIEEFHRNKLNESQRSGIFQDRFRLGNSYYIPNGSGWQYRGVRSRACRSGDESKTWHPDDFLFIPLYGANKGLIGMVSVDDPADGLVPTPESLSPLELFANQVAHCIEKTRLDRKVRDSLQKLEVAKEQLVQAEKLSAIGELVSGVAHELNNPLTGIMGYAQLLMGADCSPRVRDRLDKIRHEATRCQKIVQNLLMFARRHKPERRYHSLNEILRTTLELREYQFRVDNIEVSTDFDEALPKTMVDFFQLQQVFLNMINNAHQAMVSHRGEGRLSIRSRQENDRVLVEVGDDGPGIEKENLGRIFDPFFTTKEVGKGTGLGLSLSYGIVREHGGTIQVRSAPGQGTVMSVELPIRGREDEAADPIPAHQVTAAAAGRSILVIDDEEIIVGLLQEILTTEGHRVEIARNGLEGLDKIRRREYDLIFSDLRMPGMNGEELYEKVVEEKPALRRRIVFTTGDIISPSVQKFLKRTGNRYLTKPFSLDEVLDSLQVADQPDSDPVPVA